MVLNAQPQYRRRYRSSRGLATLAAAAPGLQEVGPGMTIPHSDERPRPTGRSRQSTRSCHTLQVLVSGFNMNHLAHANKRRRRQASWP